jgi:hypothetical protein
MSDPAPGAARATTVAGNPVEQGHAIARSGGASDKIWVEQPYCLSADGF